MDLSCYFRQDYNYCIDKSESNKERERERWNQTDRRTSRADRWMDGHSVVMQRLAREWDAPLSWELQTRGGVSPSTTVARRQLVIGDLF